MLTLLKAEDILNIGLTCTQVFYLVGKQASKGLCRFVKTDTIKTAIATLLAIKGDRANVEDIRLTDMGGLKVFTNQGIKHLPRAEVREFLTRYNQLATTGCNSECRCADDPDNLWKQFCAHKIAEHLQGVKEKVNAIASVAKSVVTPQPASDFTNTKVKRLADEAMYYIGKEKLVGFPFEEDGDFFIKVCQYNKAELGHIIITGNGQLSILSAAPGSREVDGGVHRYKWDADVQKEAVARELGFKFHRVYEATMQVMLDAIAQDIKSLSMTQAATQNGLSLSV